MSSDLKNDDLHLPPAFTNAFLMPSSKPNSPTSDSELSTSLGSPGSPETNASLGSPSSPETIKEHEVHDEFRSVLLNSSSFFGLPRVAHSVQSIMSAMSGQKSPPTNTSARTWATASSDATQDSSYFSWGFGSGRNSTDMARNSTDTVTQNDTTPRQFDPDASYRQQQYQQAVNAGTILPIACVRSPPRRMNRTQSGGALVMVNASLGKSPHRGLHKKRTSWNFNELCCYYCRGNSMAVDDKSVIRDVADLHVRYGATMIHGAPPQAHHQDSETQNDLFVTRI